MPAYAKFVQEGLKTALKAMAERHHKHVRLDLTHDEAFDLIVADNHKQILRDAALYAKVYRGDDDVTLEVPIFDRIENVEYLPVCIGMCARDGIIPPLAPNAPVWNGHLPVARQIIESIKEHLKIGRIYGLAGYAIDELDRLCDQPGQVRYLWPAVMQVAAHSQKHELSNHNFVTKWAEKISEFKRPQSLPKISPEMRALLQETSGTLTASAFLDEAAPSRKLVEVTFVQPDFKHGDWNVARL